MTVSKVRSLADAQVKAMVEAGRRLHPETFDDVSERSYRALPKRWADQVRIELVQGLGASGNLAVESAIVEQGHDLSGLFLPADRSMDRMPLIEIDARSFFRMHFTAFHELGHFLQRTDMDCYARLFSFDNKAEAKRFEELACNRFAAEVLLPDDLVRSNLTPDGVVASDACRLFLDAHFASRPAVARRLAEYLPKDGIVSFFDMRGHLTVRALASGRSEYGVDPSAVEMRALAMLRQSDKDELVMNAETLGSEGAAVGRISAAKSRSGKGYGVFVVVS